MPCRCDCPDTSSVECDPINGDTIRVQLVALGQRHTSGTSVSVAARAGAYPEAIGGHAHAGQEDNLRTSDEQTVGWMRAVLDEHLIAGNGDHRLLVIND